MNSLLMWVSIWNLTVLVYRCLFNVSACLWFSGYILKELTPEQNHETTLSRLSLATRTCWFTKLRYALQFVIRSWCVCTPATQPPLMKATLLSASRICMWCVTTTVTRSGEAWNKYYTQHLKIIIHVHLQSKNPGMSDNLHKGWTVTITPI